MKTSSEHLQSDLFSAAQFADDELKRIEQKIPFNSEFPLTPRELRKGRANRPFQNGANCAGASPRGLFGAPEDVLPELELEQRQLTGALMEKAEELVHCQAAQAPWWDLWRETCKEGDRLVQEQGFRLGGEQAAFRRRAVAALDSLRAALKPAFVEGARLNNEVRALRNKLRGVETEIALVRKKRRKT